MVAVVLVDEAVDAGLEIAEGSEHAALEAALAEPGEETFYGVEPGSGGGTKWKAKRVWRASQARTFGCWWAA